MLANVDLARPSLRHPPGCLKPSWWTAVGGPQDEPGGRSLQDSALQGDRRAPPTLAAGDESPMNYSQFRSLGRDLSGSSSRRNLQCFRPLSASLSTRLPALIATADSHRYHPLRLTPRRVFLSAFRRIALLQRKSANYNSR